MYSPFSYDAVTMVEGSCLTEQGQFLIGMALMKLLQLHGTFIWRAFSLATFKTSGIMQPKGN